MIRVAAIALALVVLPPATAMAADPLRERQWNLTMVESDAAHATATGDGALVAVIDSVTAAQAAHPDLDGRLVEGRDFARGDTTSGGSHPHGIHVAGIVAATKDNGIGVSSVAPGARVLMIRVLDDAGKGSIGDVAAGIDYAVAQGAHVINLSLSSEVPVAGAASDSAFSRALARALDAGVIVVAAAGNTGVPVCENPSAEGRVLCVGAVDRRRGRSFFSSFGRGLGLVAPGGSAVPITGENVLSTYKNGSYAEFAGTSQAAPHVSGVAALLASRGVRGQTAVRRILATTRDAGIPGPDPEYGAGIVNARQAVAGLDGGGSSPGGPGPGPGPGPGSAPRETTAASVSVRRVQRRSTVLRRGILVRCRAAGAGRCTATGSLRRRRIARGSRRLEAGRSVFFRARVNRTGRRLLRRGRRARVIVLVTLPGADPQRHTVLVRR